MHHHSCRKLISNAFEQGLKIDVHPGGAAAAINHVTIRDIVLLIKNVEKASNRTRHAMPMPPM